MATSSPSSTSAGSSRPANAETDAVAGWPRRRRVPLPLWVVLIIGAVLVIGYTCFFADPGERIWVQAMMVGSITVIVVSGLLSVRFLDMPYENRTGSIKPVEMARTLRLMEDAQRLSGTSAPAPCDSTGRPLPG